MAAALIPRTLTAQSNQRQAPVEVVVPQPPTPIVWDGKEVLAYELHITNFGQRPLALESVDVFAGLSAPGPFATLSDSALRAAFQIGARMRMAASSHDTLSDTLRIGVGERAVVFVWLERALETSATARPSTIGSSQQAPLVLRHRLRFRILDGGSATSSQIDSVVTPVNRRAPVAIRAPMRDGDWLAGEGPSNSSSHRRSIIPLNGKAWLAQRFAIDWVKIGPNGNTWHDDRSRNENFWGFGEPVLAVADADVVSVSDSVPDNTPGKPLPPITVANISGNHVILKLGEAQYVLYAHLKRASITVRPGQHVHRGDVIGLLGSSGQATAAHLHFQIMTSPSDLASEGIPFAFDQFTFIGFGRDYEPDKPHLSVPKRREMPVDDAVVHFPKGDL